VGAWGCGSTAFQTAGIAQSPGVYFSNGSAALLSDFEAWLKQFKFLDPCPLDPVISS
jgi:catalase